MVGDDFIKFYVCMHNKWNPYSKEVKEIPWTYWIIAFNFIQVQERHMWNNYQKPHAEMIGQFANPEVYLEYMKKVKQKEKKQSLSSGEQYYNKTGAGIEGGGSANARYDPAKGLVDMDGNIIIPKEQYNNMLGLDGVAISF